MKWKDSKWFQKLKSIRHIEYIVLGIFVSVVLLVMFSGSGWFGADAETTTTFSLSEYARQEEARLDAGLSRIAGAGQVKTLITYESGIEYVPAYSEDKTTNIGEDGSKNTTEKNQIVLSGGKPVILKEIQPKVKGVVVVAEGAGDAKVRLALYQAVSTLLEVDPSNIEIFAMTK